MLKDILEQVLRGEDLSRDQAASAVHAIMEGQCDPHRIAALLAALRAKGESGTELAGMAEAMRAHAVAVQTDRGPLIDTCGTGGDGAHTVNISTAAALVAAAGGAVVAKHGNRSVSSRCGSADVLEALGVQVGGSAQDVARCIQEAGIGFLFAPAHHPAMKHVMPVRRALGIRTAFNLLGPMTNPAGARRQVVGVFSPDYTEVIARALGELGSEHVLVVCGDDGWGKPLDEISTCGPTSGWELLDGHLRELHFDPQGLGVTKASIEDLRGGDAAENAAILEAVFQGLEGPVADAIAVNAGAALYVADQAVHVQEGVDRARELLATGRVMKTLDKLRRATA
ncbi:MAG: anthranilate phosphoribosyltransferase [Deltaproteobacteria bacterium]|nr:anthranilate phosphoribosyltransferase [Deltaproteobacteria bacterium]